MSLLKNFIKEISNGESDTYTLYHGTSSGRVSRIKSSPTKLFLTTDEDVAYYYASKGGEEYFLDAEIEFEKEYGIRPDEYFETDEYGELYMFKELYPENEHPVVLKIKIPKNEINNINKFMGYKGGEFLVEPKYIIDVIDVDWDELDY